MGKKLPPIVSEDELPGDVEFYKALTDPAREKEVLRWITFAIRDVPVICDLPPPKNEEK